MTPDDLRFARSFVENLTKIASEHYGDTTADFIAWSQRKLGLITPAATRKLNASIHSVARNYPMFAAALYFWEPTENGVSRRCAHCICGQAAHANDKCLWAPNTFEPTECP